MSGGGIPGVPLSTCNRSEFYFIPAENERGAQPKRLLAGYFGASVGDLEPYLYEHSGNEAVRHLFRVASGLDSMILGEDQIIGQVRQAYRAASEAGMVPSLLARLFQQASRVGKRVRRESGIGRHALSVSRACVDMARSVVGDIAGSSVLVVGAGEAGETAAEALSMAGARDLMVTNRTYSRAQDLASRLSGKAIAFDGLASALSKSDIVIGCTGSPGYVLEACHIEAAMDGRPDRPLFLMDIAVPRDIDPAAGTVSNVSLCDIDDLESAFRTSRQERTQEAASAEALASLEAWNFERWRQGLEALQPVVDMRRHAEGVRSSELQRTLKRLNGRLSDEERESLEAMTKAIVNKLLHSPTVYLKELAPEWSRQEADKIFGLDSATAAGD